MTYYQKNKKHILKWRKENKDKYWYSWWTRKYHEFHLQALQKVSGLIEPKCVRCGCKDLRFLEINHRNGRKEEKFKARLFWKAIVEGQRGIEDLEVTCKVCNIVDFVEKKYGIHYKIEFLGE